MSSTSYPLILTTSYSSKEYPSNPRPADTIKEDVGVVEGVQNFMTFLSDVKNEGFYQAIYGKSFGEVVGGFFKELGHDIGVLTLQNGDLFFLMPTIVIMFLTFFVGKNRFTKWIIPLWFAYFVSRALYYMIL